MEVLALTRYGRLGASTRVRTLQYLPALRAAGISVTVSPLFSDDYVKELYAGRRSVATVTAGYWRRMRALRAAHRYDVLWVEKECLPWLPSILEMGLLLSGSRLIVDYDDALFHRYDCHPSAWVRRLLGRKIDTLMHRSVAVLAGNEYLADRAWQAGASHVTVIPTVVDTRRYRPRQEGSNEVPVVGWIGTPTTSRYLRPLLPLFAALKKDTGVRFVAVGAREEDFTDTPVETRPWTEETEVESIQQFDIGIMPLEDSPWERGKCGYKLIQYLACGVPVVASPVGVNCEIVAPSENGLLARTPDEWDRALRRLLSASTASRRAMGDAGRRRVEDRYSLESQSARLLAEIRKAARGCAKLFITGNVCCRTVGRQP